SPSPWRGRAGEGGAGAPKPSPPPRPSPARGGGTRSARPATRRPMTNDRERARYIPGAGAEEQGRLAAPTDLINQGSLRELAPRPGESLLDVGSGLGQFTRAVARATGTRAVGVELDPRQLAEAGRLAREAGEEGLAEFRAGEAGALPLRDGE